VRRWVWLAIAIVVLAGVYALAGDLRGAGARLAEFGWSAFIAALALSLANYVVRFVRWQVYLRHQRVAIPVSSSALVFGAGLSLAITPAKLGELVKSYLLRELHGIPATRTAPIVVAERVTDLLALVVIALAGVALYGVEPLGISIAAGLIVLGLALLAWPAPGRGLIELVTRPRLARRAREPLLAIHAGLAELCRPRLLACATLLAVPAWACECVGFALIVNAFPGAQVDVALAMTIYAATTIAGALSFLPGGLGVTEGAMTVLLVELASNVDRPTALDAALLARLATLWFGVAVGLGFLAVARGRIAARAAAPPD
jgi:glycosyltransferase 2 family protein